MPRASFLVKRERHRSKVVNLVCHINPNIQQHARGLSIVISKDVFCRYCMDLTSRLTLTEIANNIKSLFQEPLRELPFGTFQENTLQKITHKTATVLAKANYPIITHKVSVNPSISIKFPAGDLYEYVLTINGQPKLRTSDAAF